MIVTENILRGTWIEREGEVTEDETCKMINHLIDQVFSLIEVNTEDWQAIYQNPHDESLWRLSYPNSELHGGGPPMLERIPNNSFE